MITKFKMKKNRYRSYSLIETYRIQIHTAKIQNIAYKKQYDSLVYDYENMKKRTKIEQKNIFKTANQEIIKQLLNIIDDLESALFSIRNNFQLFLSYKKNMFKNIQDGLILIIKNFVKVFKAYGVTIVNALGTTFNPLQHEALRKTKNCRLENNLVIEEYQKGYMLYSKLLRASKVTVNMK